MRGLQHKKLPSFYLKSYGRWDLGCWRFPFFAKRLLEAQPEPLELYLIYNTDLLFILFCLCTHHWLINCPLLNMAHITTYPQGRNYSFLWPKRQRDESRVHSHRFVVSTKVVRR